MNTAQPKYIVYPGLLQVIFKVGDSTVINTNDLHLVVVVVAERSGKCRFNASIKMRKIHFRWSVHRLIRHRRNFSASAFLLLPSCLQQHRRQTPYWLYCSGGMADSTNGKTPSTSSRRLELTHNGSRKRQKVTRACDGCKSKKKRCTGEQPCMPCLKVSSRCTYEAQYNRGTCEVLQASGRDLQHTRGQERAGKQCSLRIPVFLFLLNPPCDTVMIPPD